MSRGMASSTGKCSTSGGARTRWLPPTLGFSVASVFSTPFARQDEAFQHWEVLDQRWRRGHWRTLEDRSDLKRVDGCLSDVVVVAHDKAVFRPVGYLLHAINPWLQLVCGVEEIVPLTYSGLL